YASQVPGGAPATMFSAPRARGMTLLLSPVLLVTDSFFVVRSYLAVLSGVLMYAGFAPWLAIGRQVGARFAYLAPIAAGCFATLWTTQLYGNMAYPNLWLAFALVAGVGYV